MSKSTIASLKAEIKTIRAALTNQIEKTSKVEADNYAIERKLETARAQFTDLKDRLFAAEQTIARQSGYLARVREDDIVRDGSAEQTAPDGSLHVRPKRPNLSARDDAPRPVNKNLMVGYDKPKTPELHWVNY